MQVLFQFGWSGSAVLGGWLVDRCGFQVAFIVTGALTEVKRMMICPSCCHCCSGCMQACATLEYALLMPLVPRFESPTMMLQEAGRTGTSAP